MSLRKFVCAAAVAAVACVSFGGCYGSYALFNKVHAWNGKIGDKWINSVVHFVIAGPVYGLCFTADFFIFNTIEFWAGRNPLAMGSDIYQEADENGNKVYAVKNVDGSLSVSVTDTDGKKVDFTLVRDENVVRAVDAEGKVISQQVIESDGEVVAQVAVR